MSEQPLKRLVKTEAEVLEEVLADLLGGLVFVDPGSQNVMFTPKAIRLTPRKRVLLYLLGWKALRALGGTDVVEQVRPKDMERPTGLKGGTLRPILRHLCREGMIAQGEDGYYVPVYNLEAAAALITEERQWKTNK